MQHIYLVLFLNIKVNLLNSAVGLKDVHEEPEIQKNYVNLQTISHGKIWCCVYHAVLINISSVLAL